MEWSRFGTRMVMALLSWLHTAEQWSRSHFLREAFCLPPAVRKAQSNCGALESLWIKPIRKRIENVKRKSVKNETSASPTRRGLHFKRQPRFSVAPPQQSAD